jgi:hypothetical protein
VVKLQLLKIRWIRCIVFQNEYNCFCRKQFWKYALQNYLSTRKNRDEDILEVFNTYNINFDALKVELMLFGKMCSSNNIAENFEAHLNFY